MGNERRQGQGGTQPTGLRMKGQRCRNTGVGGGGRREGGAAGTEARRGGAENARFLVTSLSSASQERVEQDLSCRLRKEGMTRRWGCEYSLFFQSFTAKEREILDNSRGVQSRHGGGGLELAAAWSVSVGGQ